MNRIHICVIIWPMYAQVYILSLAEHYSKLIHPSALPGFRAEVSIETGPAVFLPPTLTSRNAPFQSDPTPPNIVSNTSKFKTHSLHTYLLGSMYCICKGISNLRRRMPA